MQLFNIEGSIVKPTVEVLLIEPFKSIWERDVSPNKEMAIKEFSYIEFMCSPKKTNPFSGYSIDLKEAKIIERIFVTAYTPDSLVREGVEQYEEFFNNASPALANLQAARAGAAKLNNFLLTFDLTEKNKSGMPVYKPKEISSALADTFNIMKTLESLQEKVDQQVYETVKTKNNKEINYFEQRRR